MINLYIKTEKVIRSCITLDQIYHARRYVELSIQRMHRCPRANAEMGEKLKGMMNFSLLAREAELSGRHNIDVII